MATETRRDEDDDGFTEGERWRWQMRLRLWAALVGAKRPRTAR